MFQVLQSISLEIQIQKVFSSSIKDPVVILFFYFIFGTMLEEDQLTFDRVLASLSIQTVILY